MFDREGREGFAMIWAALFITLLNMGVSGQATPPKIDAPTVEPPTWNDQIGSIIETRCVTCHAPGRSGPFSLATFDAVRNRATFLIEVIEAGRMPPWLPRAGVFEHQRTIPASEVSAIRAWRDGGSPIGEGPPKILVAAVDGAFQTDLVLQMPAAYEIPEESDPAWHSGELDVHGVNFPLQNSAPLKVRAIRHVAAAPRAMKVAAFAFDTTGTGRYLDDRDSRVGFLMGGDAGLRPVGADGMILNGSSDFRLPVGFHLPVERGSDLVAQFQYRPTGKAERLQERIELELVPEDQESRPVRWLPLAVGRVQIDAEVVKTYTSKSIILEGAVDLVGLSPRAIEICKSLWVDAVFPSGVRKRILEIPDWDHHQRETYVPVTPIRLPAGTTLMASFLLDNTSENPQNPDDPAVPIRRGRRTGVLNVIAQVAAVEPEFDDVLVAWRDRISQAFMRP